MSLHEKRDLDSARYRVYHRIYRFRGCVNRGERSEGIASKPGQKMLRLFFILTEMQLKHAAPIDF